MTITSIDDSEHGSIQSTRHYIEEDKDSFRVSVYRPLSVILQSLDRERLLRFGRPRLTASTALLVSSVQALRSRLLRPGWCLHRTSTE